MWAVAELIYFIDSSERNHWYSLNSRKSTRKVIISKDFLAISKYEIIAITYSSAYHTRKIN